MGEDGKGAALYRAAGGCQCGIVRDILEHMLERELEDASPFLPFPLLHQTSRKSLQDTAAMWSQS